MRKTKTTTRTGLLARIPLKNDSLSIIGSVFEGTVSVIDNVVHPRIKGSAFITAEADLIIDERDPFSMGIRK